MAGLVITRFAVVFFAASSALGAVAFEFDIESVYDDALFEAQYAESLGLVASPKVASSARDFDDDRILEAEVGHIGLLQTTMKLMADAPAEPEIVLEDPYASFEDDARLEVEVGQIGLLQTTVKLMADSASMADLAADDPNSYAAFAEEDAALHGSLDEPDDMVLVQAPQPEPLVPLLHKPHEHQAETV
eukprot:TRINITY_DN76609_c0_g1_i1.p2 TRINITY_DN76609_c0_g1~~TRINITY_DN76609_c0_g1_i1.p2  ORF type:complete len:189 (-),score=62.67 TRINITY_DN76609_c0_g1_i1:63-629(-)